MDSIMYNPMTFNERVNFYLGSLLNITDVGRTKIDLKVTYEKAKLHECMNRHSILVENNILQDCVIKLLGRLGNYNKVFSVS